MPPRCAKLALLKEATRDVRGHLLRLRLPEKSSETQHPMTVRGRDMMSFINHDHAGVTSVSRDRIAITMADDVNA